MTNSKRLYRAVKFNLKFYIWQVLIFILVAAFNMILAAVISKNSGGGSGSLDTMSILWIAICGATGFFYYFKFLLINGYSRKHIFIICIVALSVLALTWTLLTFLMMIMVKELNISMFNIFYQIFPLSNYGTLFLWLLIALFACALLGLFISLVFYRSGKKVKIGLLAGVSLIVPILFLIDLLAKGAFFKGLGRFFINIFGLAGATPNPFIFIATMAVVAVLCAGGSFLLMHRAQIKEV